MNLAQAGIDILRARIQPSCLFKIVRLIVASLASNCLKGLGIIAAFLAVRCPPEYKLRRGGLLLSSRLAFSATRR